LRHDRAGRPATPFSKTVSMRVMKGGAVLVDKR
jgi:hypothetical protein